MSKFFQEKFDFTNIEAGSISSLPYLVASFTVPIFGVLIKRVEHDKVYEFGLMIGLSAVLFSHFCYLVMFEHITYKWVPIAPIVVFGLGHACFTTVFAPAVPYVIGSDQELLSTCFSIAKIVEGVVITSFTQLAGTTRQYTGSYTYVTALLMLCNTAALLACYEMAYPTQRITYAKAKTIEMLNLVSIKLRRSPEPDLPEEEVVPGKS